MSSQEIPVEILLCHCRFVEHFAASSVGKVPVPSRDLSCVLGRTEDQGSFVDDDEVCSLKIPLQFDFLLVSF